MFMKKCKKILLFFVLIGCFLFCNSELLLSQSETMPRARNGLVFKANFNTGDDVTELGFGYSGNETAKIVDIAGQRAVKISLNRFEDEVSYRSEIQPKDLPSSDFDRGGNAFLDHEYWYGVRIFLPEDWEFDIHREIILQWHAYPDFDMGEDWRNPPVSLMIGSGTAGIGKNYLVVVKADSKRITPESGAWNRYTLEKTYDIGSIVNDLGKWTDWVVNVKWSYENDGFLTMWKNGKVVLQELHQANTFNDTFGPYFKLGMYKWVWKNKSRNNVISRTLYYDDIRIGNKKAGYNDVAPNPIF